MELIKKIEELLLPIIEGTDIFVVSISIKPINNIKIFLDADEGFAIAKSTMVNKKLRRQIDELELFPEGDYSLEVSSPGVDEPLKWKRQYIKNIGRNIELTLNDEQVVLGKIVAVEDENISLEVTADTKKKEISTVEVLFENIKQAIIQISF